jgi:hypothetical protein
MTNARGFNDKKLDHSPIEEKDEHGNDYLNPSSGYGLPDRDRSCWRGDHRMRRGRVTLRKRRGKRFTGRTVKGNGFETQVNGDPGELDPRLSPG